MDARREELDPWEPMTSGRTALVLFAVGALGMGFSVHPEGWVPIVDSANAVLHEAGHPIFGLLGSTPRLYGGLITQLFFPAAALLSFWVQRRAAGVSLSAVWLLENLLNIARALADARAQVLPRLGNSEQGDWARILDRWQALDSDVLLANRLRTLAMLGLCAVAVWTLWRWWCDRQAEAALAGQDEAAESPLSRRSR